MDENKSTEIPQDSNDSAIDNKNTNKLPEISWQLLAEGKRVYTAEFSTRSFEELLSSFTTCVQVCAYSYVYTCISADI
jgi:hypothetical protein